MPAYNTLIDAETWAFIRATESWYPPETATCTIDEQREIYNRMCAAFHRGYPEGITAQDVTMGGVPCRLYVPAHPPKATLVYCHGGGFVVGGLHSHDDICAEIADACHLRVVSVDYRLAPEHRHPAAFDDAMAATHATAQAFPGPVLLAGDSAGANLAAACAHALRGEIALQGQVLIYPALAPDMAGDSYTLHAGAPMLTRADMEFYRAIRSPEGADLSKDPTAAPLADRDFSGLAATAIFTAQCDPLASDGPAYAARLRAAGVPVICTEEPGLVHGYLRARHSVARARDSFARILGEISRLASA